jgi:aryl-alcohol dehydrogenase-like predicted oxidoreductase
MYGTEPIVGKALVGRRDEAVICTKVPVRSRETKLLLDVAMVRSQIEESLRDLQTDAIDVLLLHGLLVEDFDYAVGELLPEFARFRDAGSVRFFGVSEMFNSDPEHTMLDRALDSDLFDVILVGFNPFNPSARRRVLPETIAHNVGVTVMSAVHGVRSEPDGLREKVLDLIADGVVGADEIDPDHPLQFLTEDGTAQSVVEASYRFARHEPGCHVVLTGTGSVDHLRDNATSINLGPLPDVTLGRLRALFAR